MTSARQQSALRQENDDERHRHFIETGLGQPPDHDAQDAVYNRMLMAAVAGRRTMVVTDYTGGNGALLGRRMADYMTSSGRNGSDGHRHTGRQA